MKNLSDEELVNDLITDCVHCECSVATIRGKKKEVLSRLERGRKAIEFVEALIKHRDNGIDLETDGKIYNWIDEYQQTEEAADGD